MPHELPKAYDPAAVEDRWADFWVREQLFHVPSVADADVSAQRPFTLLLPPPDRASWESASG